MKMCLNRLTSIGVLVVLLSTQLLVVTTWRRFDIPWVDMLEVQSKKYDSKAFEALSFGQIPVVIDWLLLKCFVDTTIVHVAQGNHHPFYYKLDLITDLDSKSMKIFTFGGNYLSVIQNDKTGARDLLLKGERFLKNELESYSPNFQQQYWREPWRLYFLLGYVYLFELDQMPQAANYFEEALKYAGTPAYLKPMVEKLQKPGGQYDAGLRLLKFMIESNKDEITIKELKKKYSNLFIGQYFFELNSNFINYLNVQPHYHKRLSISSEQIKDYWQTFLKNQHLSEQDPWGGILSLDESGKIKSTTPHEPVFGLE